MLKSVFQELDQVLTAENNCRAISDDAQLPLRPCSFRVMGQQALIEAQMEVLATQDCDATVDPMDSFVTDRFNELLKKRNLMWDSHSHEIWMPSETKFGELFSGKLVRAMVALPIYVILSKALKAPYKNKNLIIEYVANSSSAEFEELCKKYHVDLNQFV